MRADICEPTDTAALDRFRRALTVLGAVAEWHSDSSLGVGLSRVAIGGDVLNIFSDAWSVDIDGPAELVERVLSAMRGA
jgi:hypothetical protein